ncbi:hypothetical protein [Candidatus Palauibacter sp.]|uniref:hypothetical protein n=1 Tax=Candidatus Palauibacter sp. TaxID=3101350 RepID=UPI003B021AA5
MAAWSLFVVDEEAEFTIDLTSDVFDPYLYVVGPGIATMLRNRGADDYAVTNDDGGEGLNSALCFEPPRPAEYLVEYPAEYRVVVSALNAEVGEYRLRVRSGCRTRVDPEGNEDVTFDLWAVPVTDTIRRGVIEQGEFRSIGTWDEAGGPVESWVLPVMGGERLAIEMRSAEFHPHLTVVSRSGFYAREAGDVLGREGRNMRVTREVSNNDGDGLAWDSRVCLVTEASEEYRVVASSYRRGVGRYGLLVAEDPDGTLCGQANMSTDRYFELLEELPTETRSIRLGESVEGVLGLGDAKDPVSGDPIQAWAVDRIVEDEWVTVEVNSDAFTPTIDIASDDVEELTGQSSLCRARAQFRMRGSGSVKALVSAQSEGEVGAFTLVATQGAGAEVLLDPCETTDGLEIGYEVEGRLTAVRDKAAWTIAAAAGDTLIFQAGSEEFDTRLEVTGPGGLLIGDDDGGGGTNSRIEMVIPRDGEYRVAVRAYGVTTGLFHLSVIRRR